MGVKYHNIKEFTTHLFLNESLSRSPCFRGLISSTASTITTQNEATPKNKYARKGFRGPMTPVSANTIDLVPSNLLQSQAINNIYCQ